MARSSKILLTAALYCSVASAALFAKEAMAQQRSFNIPSQLAVNAIPEFARQAGVQIVAPATPLTDVRTTQVVGEIDVRDALRILLRGTGLEIASDENNTFVLRAAPIFRKIQYSQAPAKAPTSAPVNQSQTAQSGGLSLEEITVTARRVEENIQRVPISVQQMSAERMQEEDIHSLNDLQKSIPGLQICCGRNSLSFPFVRGVPGIVTYFAEVPLNLPVASLFDIANAQVLKGPQGTLFGASTTGGAVLYQPKKPTENLEGYIQGVGGTYGRRDVEAVVNVPVINDKLFVRIGALTSHTDGYVHDLSTNKDLGDERYWTARASVTFRPIDNFENTLLFSYYNFKGTPQQSVAIAYNPKLFAVAVFGAAATSAQLATQQALGRYTITGLSVPFTKQWTNQWDLINTTTWNFTDNLSLKNIFGFDSVENFSLTDGDGTPFKISEGSPLADPKQTHPTRTWSEELQLQGKIFDDKLSFTFGTFQTGSVNKPGIAYSVSLGNTSASITKTAYQTRAIFAQGTYNLDEFIDGLSFTAGFRYTWDRRASSVERLTVATLKSNQDTRGSAKFKSPSYTISLTYQATPDTMLYVTNSKGYRPGGVNLIAPPSLRTFPPEKLNNIEAGVKSQWDIGDVQARANLSGYYGFYKGIQYPGQLAVQVNPPPAPPQTVVVVQTGGSGYIYGSEAELTVIPTNYLELYGNGAFSHARYNTFIAKTAAGVPVDQSNWRFPYAPKWTFSARATYHFPIDTTSLGDLSVSATYTWHDLTYTGGNLGPPVPITSTIPSYDNLDLTLNWQDFLGHQGLSISVFATNVTENIWVQGGFGAYDSIGLLGRYGERPRMVGGKVRYVF